MDKYEPKKIESKWPRFTEATRGKRRYNPSEIEPKWQARWEKLGVHKAPDNPGRDKFYCLDFFPYPSGEGLHVGHWRGYVLSDIAARFAKLHGKNILHPMGYDAFGLPAENAAIKADSLPKNFTDQAIIRFRKQLRQIGAMYDWEREINSSDPKYYQWTQWLFLKLYKAGLAFRQKAPVNWCPSCQTVLANEQVTNGQCERCGSGVSKKELTQWFFRITKYAERLLNNLEGLDWPERTKTLQRNWIGKSEGAIVKFTIHNSQFKLDVFTTRPDTLYGATFMVLAPEHPIIQQITTTENIDVVQKYIEKTRQESELFRESLEREKTGVFTGAYAINPVNSVKIPIWIADYVLIHYGSGAVMCVPGHDRRDFEFAIKLNLPIKQVITPTKISRSVVLGPSVKKGFKDVLKKNHFEFTSALSSNGREHIRVFVEDEKFTKYIEIIQKYILKDWWVETVGSRNVVILNDRVIEDYLSKPGEIFKLFYKLEPLIRKDKNLWDMLYKNAFYTDYICYEGEGMVINSSKYDGLKSDNAKKKITEDLKKKGLADFATNFRLRDWLISRQRYWGAPIPIIYCQKCGELPVPEKDLPVLLPEDVEFKPKGESPLKLSKKFLNTICPRCGGRATRETDTMDTFVDSSWYFLRFTDPKNDKEFAGQKAINSWMPVDLYVGGIEHATMHLLYARFVSMALHDLKIVNFDKLGEPFKKLFNIGLIYLHGAKMSKSKGNVVNPDELVRKFGTDALRGYEMFVGPADQDSEWQVSGIAGIYRFIEKIWRFFEEYRPQSKTSAKNIVLINQTIKKVSGDITNFRLNTAIASLMILFNQIDREISQGDAEKIIILLSPIFPHLAEEIWSSEALAKEDKQYQKSIFSQVWPTYEAAMVKESIINLAIQINGKLRDIIQINTSLTKSEIEKRAQTPKVKKHLSNKKILKTIYVPGKIINFVLK